MELWKSRHNAKSLLLQAFKRNLPYVKYTDAWHKATRAAIKRRILTLRQCTPHLNLPHASSKTCSQDHRGQDLFTKSLSQMAKVTLTDWKSNSLSLSELTKNFALNVGETLILEFRAENAAYEKKRLLAQKSERNDARRCEVWLFMERCKVAKVAVDSEVDSTSDEISYDSWTLNRRNPNTAKLFEQHTFNLLGAFMSQGRQGSSSKLANIEHTNSPTVHRVQFRRSLYQIDITSVRRKEQLDKSRHSGTQPHSRGHRTRCHRLTAYKLEYICE